MSHITSTPRVNKTQSDNSFNLTNGCVSPISPLYKPQSGFSGSKSKNLIENRSPICLGDFIVNRKPSAKKKISRRLISDDNFEEASKRIKPTNLSLVTVNNSFRKTNNSFNDFQNTREVSIEDVNDSRSFLVEERLKIVYKNSNSVDNLAIASKKINSQVNFKGEIQPDVKCITNRKILDRIVEIYVTILKNNLILNINSEIYFLISLVLSKQYTTDISGNSNEDFNVGIDFLNIDEEKVSEPILKDASKTVHSSDLFETVHNIVYFAVKCLEKQVDILRCYDKSALKLLAAQHRLKIIDSSFVDKLYKIAEKKADRIVELADNNVQTNICFNSDTDNRANFPNDFSFHSFRKQRDLFYEILRFLQSDPANYMHFARLFKAQLLTTCERSQKDEGFAKNQLLTSLLNLDADKLNRLNNRLVTKQTSNGINPPPTFVGPQEFYKHFIMVAANHSFNKHLCDTLTADIVELNSTNFACTELNTDGEVDSSARKSYVACVKSLRVLAKFLGFVESLPYKSEQPLYSENLLNAHLLVRQQTAPSFDVKNLLLAAIQSKNTVLAIPWMIEYIAMLDYVTLRLPYYLSLHKILFELHKSCEARSVLPKNRCDYNVAMIRFCLGWLFELPHFPDSEYFNFCTASQKELKFSCQEAQKSGRKDVENKTLDDLDIVDQNVLYICCPYLEEIKRLLSSNVLNGNVTVKHITPVTAVQSSDQMAKKRLEQQLEEAFFNGQPISVRKTIEFVSERVASTCVKHICNTIVPNFKKSALQELRKCIVSWREQHILTSPGKDKSLKGALKTKANQLAQTNLKTLKDACEKESMDIMNAKIGPAIDNLLAIDVCCAIATKTCHDRTRQWINSHVTLSVFTKDFDNEVHKNVSLEIRSVKEKPGISVDVLENSSDIDANLVPSLLKRCLRYYDENVAHKPRMMDNQDLLEGFVRVWRFQGSKTEDLFKNLLCVRNTMLLAQSLDVRAAWEAFAGFTAFLIREKMIGCDSFESQCTGLFKKEWDESSLRNFTTFLHKFVDCFKRNGGDTGKFTLLLDFLADFCTSF
ncbi:hypothetical protein NQ317_013535 [Molorchus minor]|uniref:Codanin-1 C-terminal domain-containing protein n=1 Tax=Molorchus minor TaxID=1323400 RepID=A0ABQ9JV68_9CUCU|nr:hypothetical protein NQ317_013535 [Molorchus minor]